MKKMEEKMIGDDQRQQSLEMEEQMVILQNEESDFVYYRKTSQQVLNWAQKMPRSLRN